MARLTHEHETQKAAAAANARIRQWVSDKLRRAAHEAMAEELSEQFPGHHVTPTTADAPLDVGAVHLAPVGEDNLQSVLHRRALAKAEGGQDVDPADDGTRDDALA